jgi:hypothetical protein
MSMLLEVDWMACDTPFEARCVVKMTLSTNEDYTMEKMEGLRWKEQAMKNLP